MTSPLRVQVDNRTIEYYRGDWPPKGARVQWVAGIFEFEGKVAMVCITGRGWYWPAAPLMGGEVPSDAVRRAVSSQSGGLVAWARPVAVISLQSQDEDSPGDVLQVFAGSLKEEPSKPEDAMVEHVNLIPYEDAKDVLSILVEDVPVVTTQDIIDDLVAAAQEEIAAGPGTPIFTEARHHVFTPPTFYHCKLLDLTKGVATLEYRGKRPGSVKGVDVPVGSRTVAQYTPGLGYVPWKIYGPDNQLLCTVIHLADRVMVGEDRVLYRDLLVDVFVDGDGVVSIQDQDDLEHAVAEGAIDSDKAEEIMELAERIAADPAAFTADMP